MKPRVLAIITTYNRPRICKRLLESMSRVGSPDFDVILLENRSDSDYREILKKDYGFRISHKALDDNYGLPITFNMGIRHAIREGYEFVWVLDDDTEVETDTLRYMVEQMDKNPDVAVTGSGIFDINSRERLLHAGAFFDFRMLTPVPNNGKDRTGDVDYVADCSSLARVSLIQEHNIFYDESYFFHVEDIDFPLMFKEKGYRVTVDPRSRIFHIDWAENYPARSSLIHYDVRNMLYMFMKFRPRDFRWSGLFMVMFRRNVYYFLFASIFTYLSGNIHLAHAFYLSVMDIYSCRMYRSDLYERIGFNKNSGPGMIENKEIVVPEEFTDPERRRFRELMEERTEGCRMVFDVRGSFFGKLWHALTSWKKYDLVFISNHRMHPLYPFLGKGLIKMEDNGLHVYDLSYAKGMKLILNAALLGIKITMRRLFGYKRWRQRLIWKPGRT